MVRAQMGGKTAAAQTAAPKNDGRARMKPCSKGTKLGGLEDVGIEPYENLANAIVKQAVVDYKEQLHKLLKNPTSTSAMYEAQRIEKFFRSGWYTTLTSVDGERLIDGVRILVRKEAAEKEWKVILAESKKCRKQAETLRNGGPVPEGEHTTADAAALAKELEQKADTLKAEAAGKKAEAEELERQAIKAVGFLVKEPKQKGRS